MTKNNLPTKCPGCGAALEESERWSEDEPEWTRYKCGSDIEGYSDGVDIRDACMPSQPTDMSDDAWEALCDQQHDKIHAWARKESRRRELRSAA